MPNRIESLHVEGFRTLADFKIDDLPCATMLIGANGSGKSNLLRFVEMLATTINDYRLNNFVQRHGGAGDQLFGSNKTSKRIRAQIGVRTEWGQSDYRFALAYSQPDRFIFDYEAYRFTQDGCDAKRPWQEIGNGHTEAKIIEAAQSAGSGGGNIRTAKALARLFRRCEVYQFHDTSFYSPFKTTCDPTENAYLRSDGSNLAAVLLRLERENPRRFKSICSFIQRIVPNFDRFQIEEDNTPFLLQWRVKGMDKTIGAHLTSDGSLRFFALATLLNLPPEMLPDVLLLDEPELGLHPAAVVLVGHMIKVAARERQVIVATQSPQLVDVFGLDEIFVLELENGRTGFHRYDKGKYFEWLKEHWLDEYSTGELWEKNLIGGRL